MLVYENKNYRKLKWKHCLLATCSNKIVSKMEAEALFLQACNTPLPPDETEILDSEDDENVESDVEDYLVYDEVSQVCTVCDIVLLSPTRGPLCKRCHSFMYPEYTILQLEFDEIRTQSKDSEKSIPYNRFERPNFPKYRPRHRCGKDGTLRSESVNNEQGSTSEPIKLPAILCFSDSESDEEDEDGLLGLAQLAIYDKDVIQRNNKRIDETEPSITDDLVEQLPTESMCIRVCQRLLSSRR